MLARLHQPEVALGQRHVRVAVHRADHRQPERRDRVAHQPLVPRARHLVQDHAGDPHARVVGREAAGDRRRGLRLAGDVEDQQHRHAEAPRQVGGGAAAARRRRRCRRRGPWRSRRPARRRPPPARRRAGRAGPAASPSCRGSPPARRSPRRGSPGRCSRAPTSPRAPRSPRRRERPHQPDADAGLARARARRADDQRPRGHAGAPAAGQRQQLVAQRDDRADDDHRRRRDALGRRPAPRCCRGRRPAPAPSGVVAEAITAAGVAGGEPARISAAAIAPSAARPM